MKKTVHTYNDHSYQVATEGDYSSRTRPSPSPNRRGRPPPATGTSMQPLSSPAAVRRVSPSPNGTGKSNMMSSNYSYSYSSSNQQTNYQPPQTSTYTSSYSTNYAPPEPPVRSSEPVLTPSQPLPSDGNPNGVTYYTKYHSSQMHKSQYQNSQPPPVSASPAPPPRLQTPPKRVNDLMTELSQYDSTIQTTDFVEPADQPEPRPTKYTDLDPEEFRAPSRTDKPKIEQAYYPATLERDSHNRGGNKIITTTETVYYPPTPSESPDGKAGKKYGRSLTGTGTGGSRGGKHEKQIALGQNEAVAEYEYKAHEKEKVTKGDQKQGAAVIPICLPLCCAAPCVIM